MIVGQKHAPRLSPCAMLQGIMRYHVGNARISFTPLR